MAEYIVGLSDENDAYDIENFMREYAVNGEIIRCQECKYKIDRPGKWIYCNRLNISRVPEWFCGDGSRKRAVKWE